MIYILRIAICPWRKVLVSWGFPVREVGVWVKESSSFMPGNSERQKDTKKGSSRLPEVLINNVYFCRKKGAAAKGREGREGGIFLKEAHSIPHGD